MFYLSDAPREQAIKYLVKSMFFYRKKYELKKYKWFSTRPHGFSDKVTIKLDQEKKADMDLVKSSDYANQQLLMHKNHSCRTGRPIVDQVLAL